jgi:hypothetical protein
MKPEVTMRSSEILRVFGYRPIALCLVGGITGALIAGVLIMPKPVQATPVFAGQTGLPCARCHTAPAGGKDLTDVGKDFKANGNKLKKQ